MSGYHPRVLLEFPLSCYVAVLRCDVVAVEAVQSHRDLFVDMSSGPRTPSAGLRVNGGTPRRLSSESSHSDASSHMDFSAVSTFGTVTSVIVLFL